MRRGLPRQFATTEGRAVYDPGTSDHHHPIDDETGPIHGVPRDAVVVSKAAPLHGFAVREYQVVRHGRLIEEG